MDPDKQVVEETRRAKQEAAAKKRIADARKAQQDERDAHTATMAAEAEKSKSELETYLGVLPEEEQRAVRLQAYLQVLRSDWDAGHLQSRVDDLALRLARYAVEGKV